MIVVIFCLILSKLCLSESGNTYSRTFGSAKDTRPFSARGIKQTFSKKDSFVIVGMSEKTDSGTSRELFLTRGDEHTLSWIKSITSNSGASGGFFDLETTSDGQYVTIGSIYGYKNLTGQLNPLIVKFTDGGDVTFGRVVDLDGDCEARSVFIAKNGDFLVCGSCSDDSEGFLMRMSSMSPYSVEYLHIFSGGEVAQLVDVKESPDGSNIYVMGDSSVAGDILLMKLFLNRTIVWAKKIPAHQGEGMLLHSSSIFIYGNDFRQRPLIVEVDEVTGSVTWSRAIVATKDSTTRKGIVKNAYINSEQDLVGVGGYTSFLESKNNYYYYIMIFSLSIASKELRWTVFPNFMSNSDETDFLYGGRQDGDFGFGIEGIRDNPDRSVVCGTVEIGNEFSERRAFYGTIDQKADEKVCVGLHASTLGDDEEKMRLERFGGGGLFSTTISPSAVSIVIGTFKMVTIPASEFEENLKNDLAMEMMCDGVKLWILILSVSLTTVIVCCCCSCLVIVMASVFVTGTGGMCSYIVRNVTLIDDECEDDIENYDDDAWRLDSTRRARESVGDEDEDATKTPTTATPIELADIVDDNSISVIEDVNRNPVPTSNIPPPTMEQPGMPGQWEVSNYRQQQHVDCEAPRPPTTPLEVPLRNFMTSVVVRGTPRGSMDDDLGSNDYNINEEEKQDMHEEEENDDDDTGEDRQEEDESVSGGSTSSSSSKSPSIAKVTK